MPQLPPGQLFLKGLRVGLDRGRVDQLPSRVALELNLPLQIVIERQKTFILKIFKAHNTPFRLLKSG
jgi:hypothetical protein